MVSGPSVILVDHTDLVALPALGLAAWTWTRVSRRSPGERTLRRFGVLVVLPTAALAVVATSPPYYSDVVAVASWRNLLVIGESNAHQNRSPQTWKVSRGGHDWQMMSPTEQADFESELPPLATTAERSCVPSQPTHCYRVVRGHLRVEASTDGGATWAVSWEIPDGRRGYLARSYPELGDIDTYLSSYALAVHPTSGGHVVLVANGRDGIALRDTTGSWTRLSFNGYAEGGSTPPLDARPSVLMTETALSLLVSLLVVAVMGRRLARRGAGRTTYTIMFGLGGGVALLGALGLRIESILVMVAAAMVLIGLCFALAGTIGLLTSAPWHVVGARRLPIILLISLVAAVGWWAPFIAWARGWTTYPGAVLLGMVIVSTGLALAHRIGQPVENPPHQPLEPPLPPLVVPPSHRRTESADPAEPT